MLMINTNPNTKANTKVITRITITSPSTDTRKITITSQSMDTIADMIVDTIADMIADTIAITATLPTVKTPTVNLTTTPEEGLTTITLMISLKDEVLKIMPVQKQTRAGQRTRFKAFVAIGDYNGHVGLGVKCSKEVATAIRGAIILAKLSIVPVRRGFWGNKIGRPHTVPCKVTGKCGSIWVRLIPAPRGTGIVSAPVPKKLLQMAGIEDCYTSARGSTGTLGNFAKATYAAIAKTYAYLTPDLWKETVFTKSPYQEFTDYLSKNHRPMAAQRQEVKQY